MMSFNALFFCRKGSGAFRGRFTAPLLMFFAFLIIIVPLVISAAAVAAEVNYTGDGSKLEKTPGWFWGDDDLSLFPGTTDTPLASGNKMTIDYSTGAGMTNPHFAVGGMSESGEANNNSIILLSGRVAERLYGGYSGNGNALGNSVVVSGGSVYWGVYGGWSNGVGDAVGNSVVISNDAFVEGYIYGGYTVSGTAANNVISIGEGASAGLDLYGGWSDNGSANGNIITVNGGYVGGVVMGGKSQADDSVNNTVIISGGSSIGGNITGAMNQSGNATNNTVIVSDSSAGGSVYGGRTSKEYKASNNSVDIINSSVAKDVYGAHSYYGVTNNNVTISGGSINGNVYGGSSFYYATGNTVIISGSSVSGNIYGGYLESNGNATGNTVTISGRPVFSANTYLYGGYVAGTGDTFTGNTLNVESAGISVKGVDNFEYYNFYLPQGMSANYTMLTVTDEVNLNGTTVNIYLQGNISLEEGATVTLIDCDARINNIRETSSSQAFLGAFIAYDFNLYVDIVNNKLLAARSSFTFSAENKILTNSRTAPLAFLNQGADLAASLERLEVSGDSRFTTFAVMGGGSSTYDTGSDVDIDSFSMLAGVTWNAPVKKNSLALSAFIEAGWSSYDTTNNFSGSKDVKGDGDSDYYGGGLHMRYEWDNNTPGGLYAEGSLRYGRVTTSFNSNDLQSGKDFHYDSGSNYYGVHAGLGYVWQLSGKTRLDVSGKYLWTHLESDELTASDGDQISFDAANSHRMRAGFRLYHDYGNVNAVTLYYGAAYEYEFDGDADGRLYGTYALDGSSLSGGSGIGELGVMFRPSKDNDRLTMQLGIQGYIGVREGVSGTLKLLYAF